MLQEVFIYGPWEVEMCKTKASIGVQSSSLVNRFLNSGPWGRWCVCPGNCQTLQLSDHSLAIKTWFSLSTDKKMKEGLSAGNSVHCLCSNSVLGRFAWPQPCVTFFYLRSRLLQWVVWPVTSSTLACIEISNMIVTNAWCWPNYNVYSTWRMSKPSLKCWWMDSGNGTQALFLGLFRLEPFQEGTVAKAVLMLLSPGARNGQHATAN